MSNIELETLRTEYEAARAELDVQRRAAQIADRAVVAAQSALVDAMMEAGLTDYGPITSTLVWHQPSMTHRRIWRTK